MWQSALTHMLCQLVKSLSARLDHYLRCERPPGRTSSCSISAVRPCTVFGRKPGCPRSISRRGRSWLGAIRPSAARPRLSRHAIMSQRAAPKIADRHPHRMSCCPTRPVVRERTNGTDDMGSEVTRAEGFRSHCLAHATACHISRWVFSKV